ncbi:hypothetical protein ACU8V3_19845 [Cobetia marina]
MTEMLAIIDIADTNRHRMTMHQALLWELEPNTLHEDSSSARRKWTMTAESPCFPDAMLKAGETHGPPFMREQVMMKVIARPTPT